MPRKPSKSDKPQTILLVDDNSFLTRIYQPKLESAGYKVLIAQDGEKALDMIRKHKPSLILLEIILPKINGWDIIKKVKKNKILSKIPIIVFSNLSDQEDIKKTFDLGVDEYLIKSQTMPSETINKIIKILEK